MTTRGFKAALLIVASGAVATVVTLVLFYALRTPEARSPSFAFTAWFTALQVAVSFGWAAASAGLANRLRSNVAASLAASTVLLFSNLFITATVLLFNWVLLPRRASTAVYETIVLSEAALAAAAVLLTQTVWIAHQPSEDPGEQLDLEVARLLDDCRRVRRHPSIAGLHIADRLQKLETKIRFSETIRREPAVAERVGATLASLEVLVTAVGAGTQPTDPQITRLVDEALALTT